MIRPILKYGDTPLHEPATPVDSLTPDIDKLVDDMIETMYAAPGIGLAATQVDWHHRLIVMDLSEEKNQPLVFINPEILSREGAATGEEGCLSVPGIYDDVPRAQRIRLRAQDAAGKVIESDLEGMLAVCVQHEMDHLMGRVFVEYLSPLKRNRIKTKMLKARRDTDRA